MSVIAPSELVYGSTAQASDINTTNTSWNAGTAAGTIGAVNFREEGIDRRVIIDHAVYTTDRGTNSFLSTSTITAAPGGVAVVMDFGATDYIGPVVGLGTATQRVIVAYSVWATGSIGSTLTTVLQEAPDVAGAPGVFANIATTTRRKATRAVSLVTGTFAHKIMLSIDTTRYYRLMVVGSGAVANFQYATLYAYVLNE